MKNARTGTPLYSRRNFKKLIVGSTLIFSTFSCRSDGANSQAAENLQVNAQSAVYSDSNKTVQLDGRVKVLDKEHTFTADHITITLDDERKLKSLVARGNVRFISGEIRADGDHATFSAVKNLLTLSGHPVLQRATDTIRGAELVIYDVATKTVSTEGNRTTITVRRDMVEGVDEKRAQD